jgi:hypothetical protein
MVGVLADLHGTITFSDVSTVNARPAGVRTGTALDLGTVPAVELVFPGRRSAFDFGYAFQLYERDAFSRSNRALLPMHIAHAGYSYAWKRYSFSLSETATLGQQLFANLTPISTSVPPPAAPGMTPTTPPPSISPVNLLPPGQQSLEVASESTTGGFGVALTRRTNFDVFASYTIAGGYGEQAQQYLPQQHTQTVSLGLTEKLSLRDQLQLAVVGSHITTSRDFEYVLVAEYFTWQHAITRRLRLILGAGLAEQQSEDPVRGRLFDVLPTATITLTGALYSARRRSYAVEISFASALTPVLNRVSGELQDTAYGSTTLSVLFDHTTLAATVDGAQSLPIDDTNESRVVGLGLLGTRSLGKLIDFSLGYRTIWQQIGLGGPSGRSWTAFAALSLRAPPLSF